MSSSLRFRMSMILAMTAAALLIAGSFGSTGRASASSMARPILVIANGSSAADAVLAGEVRDKCGAKLLFVSSAKTPPPLVERWVKQNNPIRIVAVGGEAVVPLELITYLELASRMGQEPNGDGFSGDPTTSARVSGPDRYATSVAVAELNADRVCVG